MTKQIRNSSRFTILLVASILLTTVGLVGQSQAPPADPSAAQAAAMAGEPYTPTAPVQPTNAPAQAAKKPGVMRIGVVSPNVQFGQVATPANASQSMFSLFAKYLAGPNLEVVPLVAQLPIQADAEAAQKDCAFVLYSTLTAQQKSSSGFGGFLKGASQMANMVPMIGVAHGAGGAIAGAAAGTVLSGAGGMASSVKAKSEVALDYKLFATGNATPVLADTPKAKAKSDGDDVITPLVVQASTAILADVLKKR
jgi:hypothetical protein